MVQTSSTANSSACCAWGSTACRACNSMLHASAWITCVPWGAHTAELQAEAAVGTANRLSLP